jgi:RHS repeat-associated protein
MRTSYNGSVEGTFTSLPWGDGQSSAGADTDANHYAMLDHDNESGTDHAQFRQYSNLQGRFLSPDPYNGSYDVSNPQSLNRYVYAVNNPLSNVDPTGLDCIEVDENGNQIGGVIAGDCPTDGTFGNGTYGIFIDASGVTGAYIDGNGDLGGYSINGVNYNADGSLMDYAGVLFYVEVSASIYYPGATANTFVNPNDLGLFPETINPNNYSKLQNLSVLDSNYELKKKLYTYCGTSAGGRFLKSVRNGAVWGGTTGAVGGFLFGEVFSGEVSFGATGAVGAYLGLHVGGAVGAMNGLTYGAINASACAALGAY